MAVSCCWVPEQDAGIKTADTVVLTGLVQGDTSTLEADTLVLSSLLQVIMTAASMGQHSWVGMGFSWSGDEGRRCLMGHRRSAVMRVGPTGQKTREVSECCFREHVAIAG